MKLYFDAGSGDLRADRRYELALQLAKDGDFLASADLLRDASTLAPLWPPIHFHLGEALRGLNKLDEATKAFEEYLRLNPADAMGAGVKLSLMGKRAPETAMSQSYIQSLFDQYAPHFEFSLVGKLDYKIPTLLARMTQGSYNSLLDLGCGTGLVAEAFHGRAMEMTGVDISPEMIKVAAAKNIYSHLHVREVQTFLDVHEKKHDIIICADVLIYMADIEMLFNSISRSLRKDGIYGFSTQHHAGTDNWILGKDHRYAHSVPYIHSVLERCGLSIQHHEECNLRKDGHDMPKGDVFIARKIKG